MYTQKVGFHIMTSDAANGPWVGRFKSAVHLMLAIGVSGEIPRLLQLCQAHPQSRFIYRAWTYGSLGQSDHFDSYHAKYGTDPLPLIRAHEPVINAATAYGFNNRISWQLFNETGHDEAIWGKFIEFNANFVKEMDRRGLSAAVLGLGPGHPAWPGPDARQSIRKAWTQARPLWEAIINARETHIVNLHEYHAWPWTRFEPWVIGRYRWMLEDIQAMGLPIDKIKVVIGESGFTDPNSLNFPSPTGPNGYEWSLAQAHTPQELADDYMEMVRTVYNHPNLLGLCYYGLGSDPGWWQEFDLLRQPEILQRMEVQLVHSEVKVVDTPVIRFAVQVNSLNIRLSPSITAAVQGALPRHAIVDTNGYVEQGGYRWRRLVSGGYCAEYALSLPGTPNLLQAVNEQKAEILKLLDELHESLAKLTQLIDLAW